MSLHITQNKCLQLIPYIFLFSSREKLDFTVEGFELHPAKRNSTIPCSSRGGQKFVHSTGHSLHSLPDRVVSASMFWPSTTESAHGGRAVWAVKRQYDTNTFYSWNCSLIQKKKKVWIFHLA